MLNNKILSRKLGYGFSLDEVPNEEFDFIASAKAELEEVVKFHPWRYIAEQDPSIIDLDDLNERFQNDLAKSDKRLIQTFLKVQGYYKLSIDGDLGKGSRRAISDWQNATDEPTTGYLTKEQYSQILLHQQVNGTVQQLNLPKHLNDFSRWNLNKSDLRYPSSVNAAVMHTNNLDSERIRLRDLYAKGEITAETQHRLLHQRFDNFPSWRDTLTRSLDNVYGQSPVFNRFWHFWINFFTINDHVCQGELSGSYYLTIRKHMTGKFEDLLYDAVWHPAMQLFLNNNESVGPNSKRARWMKEEGKIASINENLARELLELFTLTPAAGYTQDDVNNVAYILTGYGQLDPDTHDEGYFSVKSNEPGQHTVMGKTYDQRPSRKLFALCKDLASDPQTGLNIATKLARHFISDTPPQEAIDMIAEGYNSSGGDLVKVHHAVVDAVVLHSGEGDKFLQPEIWFFQVHRAISGRLPLTFHGRNADVNSAQINSHLFELGHLNCRSPQPNGWSDMAVDWITPELMDRRLRYIGQLVNLGGLRQSGFNPHKYAQALFGVGSEVEYFVADAMTYKHACIRLFCHPKFMRT